jgi:hypothetical protein
MYICILIGWAAKQDGEAALLPEKTLALHGLFRAARELR